MKIVWKRWVDPLARAIRKHQHEEHDVLGPVIVGPAGIVPIDVSNLPSKSFNFWVAHTDFNLSGALANRLEAVAGVESLDILTRYRFRLAIGRAFDPETVKRSIEDCCRGHLGSESSSKVSKSKSRTTLETVQSALASRYPFWAVYLMPDGKLETVGGQTSTEVESKGLKYQDASEVYLSW